MTERLTGITGSMFSGKTAELLRLVERAEFAGRKVQVFKPAIDNRWGKVEKVRSHSGSEHQAIPVRGAEEILEKLDPNTQLVAVDEIQFFGGEIIPVIEGLLENDIEVLFAGLPLDFRGEPFGPVPVLLAKSDSIIKLTAICTYSENGEICGEEATRTQRIVNGEPARYDDPVVLVGAEEKYAPRCPSHHIVPGKPKRKWSR
jgi:thymidine kinase